MSEPILGNIVERILDLASTYLKEEKPIKRNFAIFSLSIVYISLIKLKE